MALPTYEKNHPTWKQIQEFLPKSIHFDAVNKPTEEWWEHRGHKIHLDRWRNPSAKVRVIMHHGVGTNGRHMSMILGVPLLQAGFEAVAIDMPNYGMTQVARWTTVSYDDWVNVANEFIDHELENDPRPIVLYGLSAGGMLTYHAAVLNKKVKGIIGMTFMDQRLQQTRDASCRNIIMSRAGVPGTQLLSALPILNRISLPMYLASKMSALVNNPEALKIFMQDSTSAGNWATMRFTSTYTKYQPAVEPEDFDICPILLTQPAEDKWTPLSISEAFLGRVKKVDVKIVMLDGTGHYPLEEGGLKQMHEAIISFLRDIEGRL